MKLSFAICSLLLCFYMNAQTAKNTIPCSLPESHQFDFWLGEWNANYGDTSHAANRITKDLNDCVIHEHFSDVSKSYLGESWSVYNVNTKQWNQTWVDNAGGYIALTGKFSEGKMELYTEEQQMPDGTSGQYRMTYYNITPQSFEWQWQLTKDSGRTWTTNWAIHYRRKQ